MADHSLNTQDEGLKTLVELNDLPTILCQPQSCSDGNKITFLRRSVHGLGWSLILIGIIITGRYTFDGLLTALRDHLQLAK